MVTMKNAHKHITSIFIANNSRDKITCPKSMRETVHGLYKHYSLFSQANEKETAIRELREFRSEKEKTVYLLCCFRRFRSKSLQTKVDISVNLKSASPPCAVRAQSTECGENSF